MNKLSIVLSICVLLLAACGDDHRGNGSTTLATTSTPSALRQIVTADLIANVTVDGKTIAYSGTNYPDDNWIIYLEVELNKAHTINIEWSVGDVVVMVQQGAFTAQNYTDTVNPNLNTFSDGNAFDYDCDSVSNLQELIAGTDPGKKGGACIVESTPINAVEPQDVVVPTDLTELVSPILERLLGFFTNTGIDDPITEFTQPFRVESTDPNLRSAYRFALADRSTGVRIGVDIMASPLFGKYIRFYTNTDTVSLNPDVVYGDNMSCNTRLCTVMFDWKDQHWYEAVLEQDPTDSTQMIASLIDTESLEKTTMGSLTVPASANWTHPVIGVYYQERLAAEQCVAGLSPITLHYRGGKANGVDLPGANRVLQKNKCVNWGSGASTSEITGDPLGKIYALTIGTR